MLLSLLLAGAAMQLPPATCTGAQDCGVKWGRATQWVIAHNSRLADQTETLIRTGPADAWYGNYYQVTKIQTGVETYTFDLRIECANVFNCKMKKMQADFVQTIMGR